MTDTLNIEDFRLPKWANLYVVVVAGPYGLLLLFAPQVQAHLLQFPADPGTLLSMRLMGTSEIYAAMLSIIALQTRSRALCIALGAGNGLMDGLMTIVMLCALLNNQVPTSAWFDVVLTTSHSVIGFWVMRSLMRKRSAPAAIAPNA